MFGRAGLRPTGLYSRRFRAAHGAAEAVSAFGNDPISRASRTGSTGPRCHEGQPLAHPAGWSPEMGASPGGDAGLSL